VWEARFEECRWSKVPSAGRIFPAKAQRSGANDGEARGCRDPLEGVVAATLSVLGLWVKTQDLVVSMTVALYCVITSLGALSWSLVRLFSPASSVASSMLLSFSCFIFDLFVSYKRFPHNFVSVRLLGLIYKAG
jgi:hypothetical protein